MLRRPLHAHLAALSLAFLITTPPAAACDICAVYTGFQLQRTETGFRLGVAEQFTRFGTLQQDGMRVDNPAGEYLESSITQFLFGYQFNRRFGLSLVVPLIHRGFRRATAGGVENGTVAGFGDLSLVANVLAYDYTSEETVLLVSLFGGLQLPSGDSSELGDEVGEGHDEGPIDPRNPPDFFSSRLAGDFRGRHDPGGEAVPSGIHGHDLALGSGAVDGLVGAQAFASWKRLFATANVQYSINGTGSFDYRYANDFIASGAPGVFLLLDDDYTFGAQPLVSVETKGKDDLDGRPVDDTGFTGVYFGPAFQFTWSTLFRGEFAADFPLLENNTGLQIVPDWRLRIGVLARF